MSEPTAGGTQKGIRRQFRWILLAPILAFVALAAWAFASPIGAGPDDDFHLVSIWCANGGSELCRPGSDETSRMVSSAFRDMVCYVQSDETSAACQGDLSADDGAYFETSRGNFSGEYPPLYYATMHLFAGSDLQVSALAMRLVNAALFVALTTALAFLFPIRRRTLLWAWLVTLVPLGMFLIPSNNPSGWATVGVGTAFLALLGWFEAEGRRRWVLGGLYLVGILMAAGSRGDAAVYAAGATITAVIVAGRWDRQNALRWILPVVGLAIVVLLFLTASQGGVATNGFVGGGTSLATPGGEGAVGEERPQLAGFALAAYNVLMLPLLWTGVWGTWALGWLDTQLPAIVPWAAVAAFIVVAFAGLGIMTWRKAVAAAGVFLVLTGLPVFVLTVGGDAVGDQLQPRYLLPLIVLFAFVLLIETPGARLRFTRIQTFTVLGALALANLVALHINIRRYITGADAQGPNLDAGSEWWWESFPVGPSGLWIIGALAYAALLALLWRELRNPQRFIAPLPVGSARVDAGEGDPAAQVDEAPVRASAPADLGLAETTGDGVGAAGPEETDRVLGVDAR